MNRTDAQEIQPTQAQGIQPAQAQGIQPYQAPEVQPGKAGEVGSQRSMNRRPKEKNERIKLSYFFRVWHTGVPGAVWQTPSEVPGYNRLHIAPALTAGDLTISPEGLYAWNSYGGKTGKWVRGNCAYPVVLIDTVENKRWQVGYDPRHTGGRDIIIWDGSIWYDGRK